MVAFTWPQIFSYYLIVPQKKRFGVALTTEKRKNRYNRNIDHWRKTQRLRVKPLISRVPKENCRSRSYHFSGPHSPTKGRWLSASASDFLTLGKGRTQSTPNGGTWRSCPVCDRGARGQQDRFMLCLRKPTVWKAGGESHQVLSRKRSLQWRKSLVHQEATPRAGGEVWGGTPALTSTRPVLLFHPSSLPTCQRWPFRSTKLKEISKPPGAEWSNHSGSQVSLLLIIFVGDQTSPMESTAEC